MKKFVAVLMIAVTLLAVTSQSIINDNHIYAANPNGGSNDPPDGRG